MESCETYFDDSVFIELLEEVLYESFFDTLRTQQQLGYTVSLSMKDAYGILGFNFHIVSSLYQYKVIEEAIFRYVDSIPMLISTMTNEMFTQYVKGFIMKKFKVEASLNDAGSNQIWPCIESRDYCFEYNDIAGRYLAKKFGIVLGQNGSNTGEDLGYEGISRLRKELVHFACTLFGIQPSVIMTDSLSAKMNKPVNVLVVRAYHDSINGMKKDQIILSGSTKNSDSVGDNCDAMDVEEFSRDGKKDRHKRKKCNCKMLKKNDGGSFPTCGICSPSQDPKVWKYHYIKSIPDNFHALCGFRNGLT